MSRMAVIEAARARRVGDLGPQLSGDVARLRVVFLWAREAFGCDWDQLARLSDFEVAQLEVQYRLHLAMPPERCGPAMIAQPARGPMIATAPKGVVPDGAEGWKVEHVGYRGRDVARAADAFDLMEAQARRAARNSDAGHVSLFTPVQVAVGRRYAMLVERHEASGVRCSSVEAQRGGGSGGGSFIDTVIHEGDVIRAMRRAIGDGASLAVRRIRPSVRGSRVGIRDRALVDAVCLRGETVSDVLEAHCWALGVKVRDAARQALGGALDRMALAYAPPRCTKGLDA